MGLGLEMVTTNSTDPLPLARWWADRLGGTVVAENDGWFAVVDTPIARLGFQKVEAVSPGPNATHLDLGVDDDLDATVEGLVAAGATLIGERTMAEHRWFTLADPQGNEFCVALAQHT